MKIFNFSLKIIVQVLFVTFIFGAVSVLLVIHFKELTQAIFLHIITNTIATMQSLNIGFFAPGSTGFNQSGMIILGSIILVSWFLLFQQLPLIKPTRGGN